MKLRHISPNEDKTNEAYASTECQLLLQMYDDFYPKMGFNIPWVAYYEVRQKHLVGSCGYVRKSLDEKVEIAYWAFKDFERQGVASFACKELVNIASPIDSRVLIPAKTAPEYNASIKILDHYNFVCTEIVQNEEIGDA